MLDRFLTSYWFLAAIGAVVALLIGIMLWAAWSESDGGRRPCVREQTTYVLIGKVLTPITTCAEYAPTPTPALGLR